MLKRFHGVFFAVLFVVPIAIALLGASVAVADDVKPDCGELECTFVLMTYNQPPSRFACQSAKVQLNKRLVGTLGAIVTQYIRHENGDLKEIRFLLYDKNMNRADFSVLTTGLLD